MQLMQIGTINTPLRESKGAPIQPYASKINGTVQIFEQYAEALQDVEGFERIWLIFWCHKSKSPQMKVIPYMDDVPHGVFATRSPSRPNPIGISSVRLQRIEGLNLYVTNVDMLDKTPLLDIKPYISQFDSYHTVRNGWFDNVASKKLKKGQADRRFEH